MDNKELTLVATKNQLPEEKIKSLIGEFGRVSEPAVELMERAKEIKVTDESQTDEMEKAKRLRIDLGKVRINIEKKRVELKEDALNEGKAIDGMSNVLKALIIPVEKRLKEAEKFAENKERERAEKKHTERIEELSQYVEDVSVYTLKEMSDEAYSTLLDNAKQAKQDQMKAEKKAEDDRIANEKEQKKEQERIRKENEQLKKDQEKKDKEIAKLKAEKDAKEKKEKDERDAREKEEKKALQAPDKEKLLQAAVMIKEIRMPVVVSEEAQEIVTGAEELLTKTAAYVLDNANKL